MKKETLVRWGVLWRGPHPGFVFGGGAPVTFQTREQARKYVADNYGYIATRKDLRSPPYNWRVPVAMRIKLTLEPLK